MIEKHKLTDSNDRRRVAREIKVLKRMGQGNVIKLFEVIDSPAHIYIVMEHAASGSLLDYVRNRKRLSEADACWFFKQMLHGMQFCHDNQVNPPPSLLPSFRQLVVAFTGVTCHFAHTNTPTHTINMHMNINISVKKVMCMYIHVRACVCVSVCVCVLHIPVSSGMYIYRFRMCVFINSMFCV